MTFQRQLNLPNTLPFLHYHACYTYLKNSEQLLAEIRESKYLTVYCFKTQILKIVGYNKSKCTFNFTLLLFIYSILANPVWIEVVVSTGRYKSKWNKILTWTAEVTKPIVQTLQNARAVSALNWKKNRKKNALNTYSTYLMCI